MFRRLFPYNKTAMSEAKITRRPRIGFQVTQLSDDYCKMYLTEIQDACRDAGADLTVFAGGSLSDPHTFEYQMNTVYNYLNRYNVDALILLAGTLSNYASEPQLADFYSFVAGLPIVSVSIAIPGKPSILVDNKRAFRDAILHVVNVHGRNRLAFICGHECNLEARERFEVYRATLEEAGLPYDPALVCQGDFTPHSGSKAIVTLIDERKVDFDALVGANDSMALAAMQALNARGIAVPQDVSVVGFDDLLQSVYASPPLTTIRQPYRLQARKAVDLALKGITGTVPPISESLASELIIRSSCGCLPHSLGLFNEVVGIIERMPKNPGGLGLRELLAEINKLDRPESLDDAEIAEGVAFLYSKFFSIPPSETDMRSFLAAIQAFAKKPQNDPPRFLFWEQVLAIIASSMGAHSGTDLKTLYAYEQSRILFRDASIAILNLKQYRLIEETERIQGVMQLFLLAHELDDLYAVLPQIVSALDMRNFFLVLHDTRVTRPAHSLEGVIDGRKLLVGVAEGKKLEGLPLPITGPCLLPSELAEKRRSSTEIVAPLYYREELYGYACFEPGGYSMNLYGSLVLELGSVIKRCMLGTKQKYTESKLRAALRKLKETNQKLADLSQKDELTRLYNRRGFTELAQQSLRFAQRMKKHALLIFIDLDGLKKINDTWGHAAGDNAIIGASLILKASFRQVDIISRIGGDEFVILTLDSPYETRDIMLDRLNQHIKTYNESNTNDWDLSMSVGVLPIAWNERRPLAELIPLADELQYKHKMAKRKFRDK